MARLGSLMKSVLIASLAAGPMVLSAIYVANILNKLPAPIDVQVDDVSAYFYISLLALFIGFPVAIVLNTLGSALMISAGNQFEITRSRLSWTIAGVFFGGLASFALNLSVDGPFNLLIPVIPAAICGWICRSAKPWEAL